MAGTSQVHSSRVVPLCSIDAIDAISQRWNELARGVPFRRWEWYRAWWTQYGGPHRLLALAIYEDDEIVGIAPWYLERVVPVGNVIRFLGSGEVCSDHQVILAVPDAESRVIDRIAEWLHAAHTRDSWSGGGEDSQHWDLMELTGVDGSETSVQRLVHFLSELGYTTHERTVQNCWRIPLPATMDEYLAQLSKPNRRRVRWAGKQLDLPEFRTVSTGCGGDFQQIWRTFVALHQKRRESLGEPGCFASTAFTAFLRQAAMAFHEQGRLDLSCVSKDGRPIAAELCFRGDDATYAYQIGIDPDALRENPGWLVNTLSIRHAMVCGHAGFDLCRGDEEYKRHLGATATPCVECRVVPPRFRAQLWHTAWVTGTAMKELIKSGLAITGIR